jgi:hypothetical protein
MAVLNGAILRLALAYASYRSVRRFVSQKPSRNPVLGRVLDHADSLADTDEQACKGELSRADCQVTDEPLAVTPRPSG